MSKQKARVVFFVVEFFLMVPVAAQTQWLRQANGLPDWGGGQAIDACNDLCATIAIHRQLYQTTDGGQSWQERELRLVFSAQNSIFMVNGDGDHLNILAEVGPKFRLSPRQQTTRISSVS